MIFCKAEILFNISKYIKDVNTSFHVANMFNRNDEQENIGKFGLAVTSYSIRSLFVFETNRRSLVSNLRWFSAT
jgi:hypothetical protein